MSFASDMSRAIRDILLYRERMNETRANMAAMAADVAELAKAHAALSDRVSRIEGFIEGATAATAGGRGPRRLPKA
jgi:ubiquinone biosynthesis protein UbiJ